MKKIHSFIHQIIYPTNVYWIVPKCPFGKIKLKWERHFLYYNGIIEVGDEWRVCTVYTFYWGFKVLSFQFWYFYFSLSMKLKCFTKLPWQWNCRKYRREYHNSLWYKYELFYFNIIWNQIYHIYKSYKALEFLLVWITYVNTMDNNFFSI